MINKILYMIDFSIALILACLLRIKRSDQICLYGFYGADNNAPIRNHGDNAILEAVLSYARSVGKPLLLCLLDDNLSYKKYGNVIRISVNRKWTFLQWIKVIKQSDMLIFGGGGLFQDYRGDGGTAKCLWALNFLFWVAGRKIFWWSIGIGPLASEESKKYTRMASRCADVITVRDDDSKKMLISLGVNGDRITTTADAVYGLNFVQRDMVVPNNDNKLKTIGISLLPLKNLVGFEADSEAYIFDEYTKFINRLLNDNYKIILVAMTNQQDIDAFNQILPVIKDNRVEIRGFNESLVELCKVISDLDIVIGMRYHSYVLSILSDVPVGGVVYHPKVKSLIDELNAWQYCCDIKSVTADKLYQMLKTIWLNRESISTAQSILKQKKYELIKTNYDLCNKLFMRQ